MKWIFIFCIAFLASFTAMAQNKWIKISDTAELQMPVDTRIDTLVRPGPEGACYVRSTFKNRSVKKLPGFPQDFKVNGTAEVKITVDVAGKVIAYSFLTADPVCIKLAREALKHLQFPPSDSGPAKAYGTISFLFKKSTDY